MVLELENVNVSYGNVRRVHEVSFSIKKGEIMGIVGESGSGKSTILKSIMRLLPGSGRIDSGNIRLGDTDLTMVDLKEMRKIRGRRMGMIFQSPVLSYDPLVKIKDVFFESMQIHDKAAQREQAYEKCEELLSKVGFSDTGRVADSYPFELSGGMCQRSAIALAMIHTPEILLADEPTSALDVKSQLTVIETLKELREKEDVAILIVTHNIGMVGAFADNIGVMIDGHMVEYGSRDEIFNEPVHSYTKTLIESVPKTDGSLPKIISFSRPDGDSQCKLKSQTHWYKT